jgi:hypothetical protein
LASHRCSTGACRQPADRSSRRQGTGPGRQGAPAVVRGARNCMGEHGEGVALALASLQACKGCLARGMVASAQPRGFGKGPREGGMADLRARGPVACASGFLGARDEATRGDERLHPWTALDLVDLIAPHESRIVPPPGIPSWAQRSACQAPGEEAVTQTTRFSQEGAIALRKDSGAAFICRCSTILPS